MPEGTLRMPPLPFPLEVHLRYSQAPGPDTGLWGAASTPRHVLESSCSICRVCFREWASVCYKGAAKNDSALVTKIRALLRAPAQGHTGAVTSLCTLRLPCGGLQLASTAADSDVRVWRCSAAARELGVGSAGEQRAGDAGGDAASGTEHGRSRLGAGGTGDSASMPGTSTDITVDEARAGGTACGGSPNPAGIPGIGQGGWALQQAINVGGRMQHAAALTGVPGKPCWCRALALHLVLVFVGTFCKGHGMVLQ